MPSHEPVDLSLMYTCRLVASEMKGLPLRLNPITFSTVDIDEVGVRAAYMEELLIRFYGEIFWIWSKLCRDLTAETVNDLAHRFPDLPPIWSLALSAGQEIGMMSMLL